MNGLSIAVIDYGIGNMTSMVNALTAIGAVAVPTRDAARIAASDALVLPGVGAFKQGMDNLRKFNLLDAVNGHINKGKPFLGVCLGMQLLLDESEEFGITQGLGIIKGRVRKLELEENSREKLPHIGWNSIRQPWPGRWNGTIFETVPEQSDFYFVHSFAAEPENHDLVLSVTDFGGHQFCSALKTGSIYGCQFHPEKSGPVGLAILRDFVAMTGK